MSLFETEKIKNPAEMTVVDSAYLPFFDTPLQFGRPISFIARPFDALPDVLELVYMSFTKPSIVTVDSSMS